MQIQLGNCVMERGDAERLCSMNPDAKVYMIDERDEIYDTLADAMDAGRSLAEDWEGEICVSEYSINIFYDEENYSYELKNPLQAPLEFTGRYWKFRDGHPIWYAVLMDENDSDFGCGNFDFAEAVKMARSYGDDARIAVINDGPDPICERVILAEDFPCDDE